MGQYYNIPWINPEREEVMRTHAGLLGGLGAFSVSAAQKYNRDNAGELGWRVRAPEGTRRYPGGPGDATLAEDVQAFQGVYPEAGTADGKLGPKTITAMNNQLRAWAARGALEDEPHSIAMLLVLPGMPSLPAHAYLPADYWQGPPTEPDWQGPLQEDGGSEDVGPVAHPPGGGSPPAPGKAFTAGAKGNAGGGSSTMLIVGGLAIIGIWLMMGRK